MDLIVLGLNFQVVKYYTDEEIEMLKELTKDIPNVKVASFSGLLVDFCKEMNCKIVIRGLRALTDFEYEFQMALANKKLYEGAETIFLAAGAEHMYLSSSLVKQIAHFGGDISGFVPDSILQEIQNRLSPKL